MSEPRLSLGRKGIFALLSALTLAMGLSVLGPGTAQAAADINAHISCSSLQHWVSGSGAPGLKTLDAKYTLRLNGEIYVNGEVFPNTNRAGTFISIKSGFPGVEGPDWHVHYNVYTSAGHFLGDGSASCTQAKSKGHHHSSAAHDHAHS